jgi:Protein of unknown function (DUF2794)
LSETDPIQFRPRDTIRTPARSMSQRPAAPPQTVCFNRLELNEILLIYGRKVAAGEWRDYAIDFGREKAVVSVYRRSSEVPLYRIEKNPKLARKHGTYCVIAATGLILKRGHDLKRVLDVFESSARPIEH